MAVTSITPANPQAPAPVPAPAPGAESRSPTPRPEPAVADPLLDAGQLPGPPSPASSPPPQTYAPTATQGPAEGQKLPAEVAEGGQPVQRQPGLPPGKGPDGLGPPGLRQDGAVTPGPGGGGGGGPALVTTGGGVFPVHFAPGGTPYGASPGPSGSNQPPPPAASTARPAPGAQAGQPNPLPAFNGQPNNLTHAATAPNGLPGTARPNALPPSGVPTAIQANGMAPGAAAAALGARAVGQPLAAPLNTGLQPAPQSALVQAQFAPLARTVATAPWAMPPQAVLNPRAEAAAAALQAKGPALAPPPAVAQAAAVPVAVAAKPNQASLGNTPASLAQVQQAAAGRPALAVPGSAQAVAQAQTALAQTLGRLMAGQMTAGGAATAMAEAQLALRTSRMALAQQGALMGALPTMQAQQRAAVTGALAIGAQAQGQGAQPLRAGTQVAGPLAGGQGATMLRGGAAGEPGQPVQLAAAAMPRALATALAMAPKQRRRGSHDRVEAVDRDTPRQHTPEMEDEDFWDALGEAGEDGAGAAPEQDQSPAEGDVITPEMAAQAAAQHYRAVATWLGANDEQALLRELAAGRRVLVLAPPDQSHQRLIGHLLRPDAARPDRVTAPGTTGRAWALAARWSATLPADPHWRQWRVRQAVSATGEWCIETSQPNRYTPRLAASESRVPAGTAVGEAITLLDPRRLRRLMGSQWTLAVLRVPVPLDAGGTAG